MILFFSGTGNSRHVADQMGRLTGDRVIPMEPSMKVTLSVGDDRLIWVFPIYSWGIPPIVRRVIASMELNTEGIDCFMVCTCGDDTGLAHKMWRRDIARRGWNPVATYSVQMPNNYVCMKGFDVDPVAVADAKLASSVKRIASVADRIVARAETDDVVTGSWAWVKTRIIYPWFVRYAMSPRPFCVNDDCISCGSCARVCPRGNIVMKDGRPYWNQDCAFCLACYHICPRHAVNYGNATRDKGQYFFPGKKL